MVRHVRTGNWYKTSLLLIVIIVSIWINSLHNILICIFTLVTTFTKFCAHCWGIRTSTETSTWITSSSTFTSNKYLQTKWYSITCHRHRVIWIALLIPTKIHRVQFFNYHFGCTFPLKCEKVLAKGVGWR